jgi:uncharacterized protein (TIGR02145 family)
MCFKNIAIMASTILILLSLSVFAQKEQKEYYVGTWYASTYISSDKELSSVLSPSIEFFGNGTYRFSTALTSYNGKWKLKNDNIITLTRSNHSKNNTEVYKSTSDGLVLTDIIENGHRKSATSAGIKTKYGKSGGKSCPGTPTIAYKGKTYHTVQIGNQCWFKENLDIGTMIKGDEDQKDNGVIEKYCFNDDTNNCNKYGGLYQWNEAMQYSSADHTQGICPSGWHIFTKEEYQALEKTVNKDGNSLKAQGQGIGVTAGTNTTGFSGLFAGYRKGHGGFSEQSQHTYYWARTEADSGTVYNMHLGEDTCTVDLYYYGKTDGFSIRCIKN